MTTSYQHRVSNMSSRDKDQADFDLEAFADLFDTAMTSNNPAVKKAFKNLMIIAAIVDSENKNEAIVRGPMRRLVEEHKDIVRRIQNIESQRAYPGGGYNPAPMPSYPAPTWVGPNTIPTGPWVPPNVTITSTTAVDDQYAPDPNVSYTINSLTSDQVRALSGFATDALRKLKEE